MRDRQLSAHLYIALNSADQDSLLQECYFVQQNPLTFPAGNHSWCILTPLFIIFLSLVHLLKAHQSSYSKRAATPPLEGPVPSFVTTQPTQFGFSLSPGLLPGLASKYFETQACVLPSPGRIPSWSDLVLWRNIPKPKCSNKKDMAIFQHALF